jgi:hypothetical protein
MDDVKTIRNLAMKTQLSLRENTSRTSKSLLNWGLFLALATGIPCASRAADAARIFASPEEAVASLGIAVKAQDSQALKAIFGSAAEDFENPDRVQATNEFKNFAAAMTQTNHISLESPGKAVLEVGPDAWPFPIPIVKKGTNWFFDAQAGKEEILNRRIGRNELEALAVVRAYVDAQREYASKDRNNDQVLEYAQRLNSTPGKHDGLYWPLDDGSEQSPLGPLVANAQEEGYNLEGRAEDAKPLPFHGYYFKILKRQGSHGAAGKYNFVINGHMLAGFALVAWPAEWGESGVMTFIVNQEGRVYQKDLGPKTAKTASSMDVYDPDPTWKLSPD